MNFHNTMKRISIWILRILFYFLIYLFISIILDRPAFPKPWKIVENLFTIVLPGFLHHLPATLFRWFIVFFAGSILGFFMGILIGYFKKIHEIVKFEIDFFRSLPATVLIVFLLAAFGDGHLQRSLPVLYITFFTVLFYVAKHMLILNRRRIQHLLDLGASRIFVLRHCVYYELLPVIMVAIRQAISLSFLVAISVELIVGSFGNIGLGTLLYDWKFNCEYAAIIGGLLVIGTIGFLLNIMMLKLQNKLLPWTKVES